MTMVSADGESTRSLIGAGRMGSLERAIEGDYELSIRDVLSEAWDRTSGVKGQFWRAFLYLFGLGVLVSLAGSALSALPGIRSVGALLEVTLKLVFQLFAIPVLETGITMMGVHRASNKPVEPGTVFAFFYKAMPLLFTKVLRLGLVTIGLLLFILPGVYLLIAYSYAPLLVVDKDLTPWQALETSRKAVTKHWYKFFSLGLVMMGIVALSVISLGIGLIWTLPWAAIIWGITYRTVFGVATQESEPR